MKHGEIIQLGNHRLMCGDATKREDVMSLIGNDHVDLVLTDPPYGIKVQHTNGVIGDYRLRYPNLSHKYNNPIKAKSYAQLIGDNTREGFRKHYTIIRELTQRMIVWGGQNFADFLPVSPSWIFWDKQTGNNDFSDGELAYKSWGRKIKKYTQLWNGVLREGNYTLNPKPRIHPTQKPVELHMKILEDFTKPDDVILDCFGGSGTTLIACNETGRKCLMMELSPDYCDIIVERYDKLTQGSINF